jgi:nitrate reductase gamma subunit
MSEIDFLNWVRGPGFQIATVILVAGVVIRILEILLLGRKTNLAEAKGSEMSSGLKTIITRSVPCADTFKRSSFVFISGYVFHLGLFITVFLFAPHILLIKDITGLSWPSIPTAIVDAVTVISIISLLALMGHRFSDPVRKHLTQPEDLLIWVVTIAPLITGYIAFHRIGMSGPMLLGIHILTVELLMIVFPFTKLMHAFTLIMSRWYNGATSGYRGVES